VVRILSRHFLASYFGFYVAILLAALLVIAIIEMTVNLERALEFQRGTAGVATYLLLRLPSYYLPYLLPVASFGAAFLCIGLSARAQEILGAKAGGVPPLRIAAPVLAAALALSLVALALFESVVRDSGAAYQRTRHGDAEQALFRNEGSFWYQRGRLLYNVQEADRETRTLRGVRVYERDDEGRLQRAIHAESARIAEDGRWELHRATVRSFDLRDPAAAPRVELQERTELEVASQQDIALLDADARNLPLPELAAYIRAMERSGRDSARYRALLHMRMTEPLTLPLFALLALPLGLAVERTRSLAVAALQGIVLLGAFYGASSTVQILAAGGVAAAVPAPWFVLGGFAGFGILRLLRAPA
jgi:lipopolysaccharide export system permease protein